MKLNPTLLEVALVVMGNVLFYLWLRYRKRLQRWWKALHTQRRGPRELKPRAPEDCPKCSELLCRLPRRAYPEVIPWSEFRSPRGRKKTIDTSGHACLNLDCHYFGVTDADIHALVCNGHRGANHDIPYFKCQACGSCRSSRVGTPLYHLKTSTRRIAMVLHALTEGMDISAASRVFGHHPSTLTAWLVRSGQHSMRLHEQLFSQPVTAGHVQLDELVTRVKQDAEKVWLWTAITARSKLILAVHAGGRSMNDAHELLHKVQQTFAPDVLPAFTSDGLNHYFYAITAHFGSWQKPPRARKFHWIPDERLQYAQLRKLRQGRKVTFLFSIIRLGTRQVLSAILRGLGLTGKTQTSYIERSNLTLRELIAPLSRRTWSMAFDREHLLYHLYWGLAYYHLVRPHRSLEVRVRGPSRKRYRTPAMAAGLTHRPWSIADILLLPLPEGTAFHPFPAA